MNLPPILLTSSAIAMDPSVALKSQESRIFHTLESIGKWAQISPSNKFVICDGSGFDFAPLIREHFPGLKIECIFFTNDPALIGKHGKGFGEGEIIRYALINSRFLSESDWFVKCTAKLWVDNFLACIREWNGQFLCKAFFANVFTFKPTSLEYIDTRFYMVSRNFYLKNFSNIYTNLSLEKGSSIEGEFLKRLIELNLKNFLFRAVPVISGVGGGSGKYYNTSYLRRLKEVMRSKLVAVHPKFQKFFIQP
jgi:hypothetical protein